MSKKETDINLIHTGKTHRIDADKINKDTFETFMCDVVAIFKAMDLRYSEHGDDRDKEINHLYADKE